ncbi:MAG: hypothetical protein LIP10_12235 [Clostridiales bacterium]|nr:hypothetical protein [Clostridiales bacterium]
MRYDARTENWMSMEVKGIQGYFSDMRIDRDSVPEECHFWELADCDSDGMPCRYRPAILVNFFGTFITTGELPIDDEETQTGYIEPEEWDFTGDYSVPYYAVADNVRRSMRISMRA